LRASSPIDPATFSHSTTTNVYDSQGVKRAVSLYFQRQPDETVALTPDAADPARRSFEDPATGETVASANVTRYRLYAAVDGAWLSLSGAGAIARQGAAAPDFAVEPPGLALDTLEFYNGVSLASLQGRRDQLAIRYEYAEPAAGGAAPSNRVLGFSLDLTDATNYAETFAVRDARQDGYPTGSLSGIQVDETGRLLGEYTNGKTLTSGQVVLADFVGMGGLSLVGPNVFAQTGASGEPRLGTGSVQGFGAVRASALEEANIDMASELVKLMVQQRNYQANAQSIRTADSLISTIINMRG
jgi:flagellar hook protein FlgE